MKTVKKTVLVPWSEQQMFDLVADVGCYAQFLPWCRSARVLEVMPDGMVAEVGIALKGFEQSFTTRNTHTLDAASGQRHIEMRLVHGPFSRLHGRWSFTPIVPPPGASADAPQGSRVELALEYGFNSFALSMLVGPVFDRIANTMVDAFVQRAAQVHGKNPSA